MGWPFCFRGNPNINVLPTLIIQISTYGVDQYYNKKEFSIISGHTMYRQHPAQQTLRCDVSARKQGLCQATSLRILYHQSSYT